jgi:hypothetical protein
MKKYIIVYFFYLINFYFLNDFGVDKCLYKGFYCVLIVYWCKNKLKIGYLNLKTWIMIFQSSINDWNQL